jgi:hypothetical protein
MAVAPSPRENTHFSMERGTRIINYVQVFFVCVRIRESYEQF